MRGKALGLPSRRSLCGIRDPISSANERPIEISPFESLSFDADKYVYFQSA
jgi:hypothetical protein